MPNKTKIEWTDFTSNPIAPVEGGWGCTKVSPGCKNCYAESLNRRFGNHRPFTGSWRFQLVEGEVKKLLRSKAITRKRVFLCDMCDLFHPDVPFELIDKVMSVVAHRPGVTFQVLTKRPERMAEYFSISAPNTRCLGDLRPDTKRWYTFNWPLPNLWIGTSVEDQKRAKQRIPWLLKCPGVIRFLSLEPLLGVVNLSSMLSCSTCGYWVVVKDGRCPECAKPAQPGTSYPRNISWVIVGGESGVGARPCPVYSVGSIVHQCASSCTPVFVKQLGSRPVISQDAPDEAEFAAQPDLLSLKHSKGGDMNEWPGYLQHRQMPREWAFNG